MFKRRGILRQKGRRYAESRPTRRPGGPFGAMGAGNRAGAGRGNRKNGSFSTPCRRLQRPGSGAGSALPALRQRMSASLAIAILLDARGAGREGEDGGRARHPKQARAGPVPAKGRSLTQVRQMLRRCNTCHIRPRSASSPSGAALPTSARYRRRAGRR
jgi:hypothetical protein